MGSGRWFLSYVRTLLYFIPYLLIDLMRAFLQEIQATFEPIQEGQQQWVKHQANVPTWEHASWLNADDIEDLFDNELNKQFVYANELDGATEENRMKRLHEIRSPYVHIVDNAGQFHELIDREVIASQVLTSIVKT